NRPCPACYGRGQIPSDPCRACGGSGQHREQRTVSLTVPAGVETGSKIRLSGQGERGVGGGAPGDVIITFRVKPHRFFERDGLRIPPGPHSGPRFRIPGQGLAKSGRRGDQYVKVRIVAPESLTEEQAEEFRKFAEGAGLRW